MDPTAFAARSFDVNGISIGGEIVNGSAGCTAIVPTATCGLVGDAGIGYEYACPAVATCRLQGEEPLAVIGG